MDPDYVWPSKLDAYASDEEDFGAYIIAEDGDKLVIDFPCDLTISTGVTFQ